MKLHRFLFCQYAQPDFICNQIMTMNYCSFTTSEISQKSFCSPEKFAGLFYRIIFGCLIFCFHPGTCSLVSNPLRVVMPIHVFL